MNAEKIASRGNTYVFSRKKSEILREEQVITVETNGDSSKDWCAYTDELGCMPGGNATEYSKQKTSWKTWQIGLLSMKITKCLQLDYLPSTGKLRLRGLETSFQESSSNAPLLYFTHYHFHSAYGIFLQIDLSSYSHESLYTSGNALHFTL